MKRFKYKITDKEKHKEVWVCPGCKKIHNKEILMGRWKLFDIADNTDIMCGICENDDSNVHG